MRYYFEAMKRGLTTDRVLQEAWEHPRLTPYAGIGFFLDAGSLRSMDFDRSYLRIYCCFPGLFREKKKLSSVLIITPGPYGGLNYQHFYDGSPAENISLEWFWAMTREFSFYLTERPKWALRHNRSLRTRIYNKFTDVEYRANLPTMERED